MWGTKKKKMLVLVLYCEQYQLVGNNSKTKVVVLSRGRMNYGTYDVVFREENTETISEYLYLGILLNYYGRFRTGQVEFRKKGYKSDVCTY